MRLIDTYVTAENKRVVSLEITDADTRQMARLDGFDRELLKQCNDPEASVSDRLLGFEMLARKIEQGAAGRERAATHLTESGKP